MTSLSVRKSTAEASGCLITIALPKAGLKKLFKEEVINLALDYQSELDSTLGWIRNELSEMKKDFEKLG